MARYEQKHRGLSLAHWCMKVHRMYQRCILEGSRNDVDVFQEVLRWVAERWTDGPLGHRRKIKKWLKNRAYSAHEAKMSTSNHSVHPIILLLEQFYPSNHLQRNYREKWCRQVGVRIEGGRLSRKVMTRQPYISRDSYLVRLSEKMSILQQVLDLHRQHEY